MGWVADLLEGAMKYQREVLGEFAEEKKAQGYGRAGEVIVDGPEGGVFQLWFTSEGLDWKPPDVPVRTRIYMKEGTLLRLITPRISLPEIVKLLTKMRHMEQVIATVMSYPPELDVRIALANKLILVGGEKPLYDAAEIRDIWTRVVHRVFYPMTVKAMVKQVLKESGKEVHDGNEKG